MPKSRILVVDDSAVFRRALSDAFAADPDLEVVGTASNGQLALEAISRLKPDLVTLDVEMPVMDGLQTVSEIRKKERRLPILMFSTLTSSGAGATLEALNRGASDYCCKPTGGIGVAQDQLKRELLPKVRALLRLDRIGSAKIAPVKKFVPPAMPASRGDTPKRVDLIAIGCSTGGPNALANVLPLLPADLPCPVVVVQHMPPVFTRLLAERLDSTSKVKIEEAAHGSVLEPGKVLIAPGDHHMVLERSGTTTRVRLNQDAPENFCRPAVDPLFRSVASIYGGSVLAVILTGMGRDGTKGCEDIRRTGGYVIGQDEATSVVWGMPGSIVEKGLANEVLPLERIAGEIAKWAQRGRVGNSAGVDRRPASR